MQTIMPPTPDELRATFEKKYATATGRANWGPQVRRRFQYFSPDEHYETLVNRLVKTNTAWLDVGCGRFLFPSNRALATELSARCRLLYGVDPDKLVNENADLHGRSQVPLEEFETDLRFDLVTMRMVAEHVVAPDIVVGKLAYLLNIGGRVVVYTIFRWSPIPVITVLVPFGLHHAPKRFFWGTEKKDTFPVAYRMNTRSQLERVFVRHGFKEAMFVYLDDCRTLHRFRLGQLFELSMAKALNHFGLHYPEVCILGVYEKVAP